MAGNKTDRAEARAFNRGLGQGQRQGRDEMKNEIHRDLEKEISWIGPKSMPEITKFITDRYEKLNGYE